MPDKTESQKNLFFRRLDKYISERQTPLEAQALIGFSREYFQDHSGTQLANVDLENLYTNLLDCRHYIIHRQLQPEDDWELRLQLLGSKQTELYRDAFPISYRARFTPHEASADIQLIGQLDISGDIACAFSQEPWPSEQELAGEVLHFKIVSSRRELELSELVPILEQLGTRVLAEHPFEVTRTDGKSYVIHDFGLRLHPDIGFLETPQSLSLFQEAFIETWRGRVENDGFNRLILCAGLNWREAALLRAYGRYIRQTRLGYSQDFIAETLCRHPELSHQLVTLFHIRLQPEDHGRARVEETHLENQERGINQILETIEGRDEDVILRRYLEIIQATLRTNYYQKAATGGKKSYFSFKFDPAAISGLPLPRPTYEIFVYSPRVEGVHLRSGKVARGGLRWSDRQEDYRTEVLGLVKAQQVKNSVIVPMGAKGCFITKQMPEGVDRDVELKEGKACYELFIRGLLDITDNLVDGMVVPPGSVVRHDGDDPYLVVAADKGTASFSDIANSIAAEYNFWLGDAFASGGSQGYDHKQMGITAKGTWESVKRHFREQGADPERDPITAVGIGDMSGDVFGNGMLLSESIQLLAAFNHQYIFIDPNPNCETAFNERQRLFQLPGSSWSDYHPELISAGGGVFPRNIKWIPVTPQMQARFEISASRLSPPELIRAILKSPVQLIWNGGIGTYVKESGETHLDVSDKANDALRIDGKELRCKVLGEGGNLGITQRGRIEFALNGGACNSDFIDNAGGVDCSDHEVNIKILLNEEVASGRLSPNQRNRLLQEMTEELSTLVLRNNYRQAQALALAQRHARKFPDEYIHLIDGMERVGKLDRELEAIPTRKTLLERRDQGLGLTRPELSVLISYTRNELKQSLIDSWVTDDPLLARPLTSAFPPILLQRYLQAIYAHPLRREITASQITNELVNRMGVTYIDKLRQATGSDDANIVAAYVITREIYGIEKLWNQIEALDNKISASIQDTMLLELNKLVTRASWWLLRRRRPGSEIAACIDDYQAAVSTVTNSVERLQATIPGHNRWYDKFRGFTNAGVPELLAATTAAAEGLYWLLDIIDAASELDMDISALSPVYFSLGEHLELPWLDRQMRTYRASNHWQSLARDSYRDDLDAQQRAVTIGALKSNREQPKIAMQKWVQQHQPFLGRWQSIVDDMKNNPEVDCALFTVAINILSELSRNADNQNELLVEG